MKDRKDLLGLEDLDAVRGIGPKKLAKMAEYLSFSAAGRGNAVKSGVLGADPSVPHPSRAR